MDIEKKISFRRLFIQKEIDIVIEFIECGHY